MAAVVVTGAAGFIGWHLTRKLAAAGEEVRAVDMRPQPPGLREPGISYRTADIRDDAAMEDVLEGATTVYHLASAHLDVASPPELYREINVAAAESLVRMSSRCGVRRFVHTSSVGIYGHVANPPAREDTGPAPGNVYERTKLEGEEAVRCAAAGESMQLMVLRPAWVYGPGCPRMAKLLRTVKRRRFVYLGTGTNLRHPIYIDDLVTAFMSAAEAPRHLSGRAYVVAGPAFMTLKEMVGTCAQVLGVEPPRLHLPTLLAEPLGRAAELVWGTVGRQPPFSRRSIAFFENDNAFDTAAARTDLGFESRVGLEEGVARTLEDRWWPVGL